MTAGRTASRPPLVKRRQAIHTYPFSYRPYAPEELFAPEPAAVYIHVPFCERKCHFCDFTVQTNSAADLRERYVRAVRREIERFTETRPAGDFLVDAVYVGGGTPGLLEAEQLTGLLATCRERFPLSGDCEITVEFEPTTVTAAKLSEVLAAGCNRVSVGVQSFDDELLRRANRTHDRRGALRALELVAEAGIANLNLDLIYPLPGLTPEIWRSSIDQALAVHPASVSLYGLEIWPGTAYHRWLAQGSLELPEASAEVAMYLHAAERLERAGYVAESTNGYVDRALAPAYCRYLDYYWRDRPLLGFGVSSRSAVGPRLWRNLTSIQRYLEMVERGGPPLDLGCVMTAQQRMRRFVVRGFKSCRLPKDDFATRFGVELTDVFPEEIGDLVALGLVEERPDAVVLTMRGRAYAPNVYHRFYTGADLVEPSGDEVRYGISALVDADAATA
jgi:oxygen-independent coproporphyrinogen-3 oxidase